jgi:hypothetical protein
MKGNASNITFMYDIVNQTKITKPCKFKSVDQFSKFGNPAQFWPEPDLGRICKNGRIRPEPNSGTALK